MKTLTALAVVSLAAAALLVPAGSAAAAAPVRCGDTISGSATLTEDLRCQDSTGLKLTPGATLDLGGHTLYGDGDTFGGPGIRVPDAGDVLVTNGTVRGWGIAIANADDGTPNPGDVLLSHLTLFRNGFGVALLGFSRSGPPEVAMQLTDSTLVRNESAVFAPAGRFVLIHSYVKAGGRGIDASSADVLVRNSIFQTVDTAVECFDSSCSVSDSTIRDGRVGVDVYQNYPNRPVSATGNQFTRLGTGIHTGRTFAPVTISRNRFAQAGVAVDATDTTVSMTHNDVRDGTTGFTYNVTSSGGGHVATVALNSFAGNHDGIYVDLPTAKAAGLRLGSNAAIDNVDYGIFAPGATDRGGNTASGNGHDPQCVGVVCGP